MPAEEVPERPRSWRDKLDPRGRRRLAKGELEGRLEMMIRTDAELTPGERQALRRAGCEIGVTIGNVATARAGAESLEAIAGLAFVRRIELSRVMYQE